MSGPSRSSTFDEQDNEPGREGDEQDCQEEKEVGELDQAIEKGEFVRHFSAGMRRFDVGRT